MFTNLTDYLTENGIKYNVPSSSSCIAFADFETDSVSFTMVFTVDEKMQRALIRVKLPVKIRPEKRSEVAEFLCRINWELVNGNFEMDFATGELQFRITTDYKGACLNEEMIADAFETASAVAARYFPLILEVNFSQYSAEMIFNRVLAE